MILKLYFPLNSIFCVTLISHIDHCDLSIVMIFKYKQRSKVDFPTIHTQKAYLRHAKYLSKEGKLGGQCEEEERPQ